MARVLYLITSSGVGGAELALWQLLRRLDRSRWEPTVVSLKPPGEIAGRIRALGIEVLSPGIGDETGGFAALELFLEARRLPRLLGGRRFDIVHSLLFRANLLARLAAPRLGRPPLINAVRVTPEEEGPWMRRVDRWSSQRVTCFVALSAALAGELEVRLALTAGRVRAIANGVDLAEADRALAAARPTARRQFGLFPPEIAIACVGRLHRQKGLVHLLGAFHALLQVQPTARLLIAGEGPDRLALEGTVATLRLGPFVRFLGALADPWPLLAAADIFALPSLWEGMPNALLEAMAAGLPAVATAVGAVPEMVVDGREALVVPPGDAGALARALAELAAWPARRHEMGALARRRVEDGYRIETTVASVEQLYRELLGEAGVSEAGRPAPVRSGVTWRELAAVAALLLLLGVVFTWPLSRHLTTDILYTHEAPPGYERVSLTQGDHLQLIYCYWLFGDSVRAGRSPLEDPYQFRDGSPPGFFFQPSLLPLLTLLLSPLGLITAYNLLLLLSFVAAGLAMHLLLRLEIDDPWAALAGALIAALLPFRVMQLATHANGFLSFLIPLYLFFFERSLRGPRRWGWIAAAGVTVFFAGAMEFHIIYYLLLFLGLYLPFRFVAPLADWLETRPEPPPERRGLTPALLAALGGAGVGIAAYHAADRVHHFNDPAGWVITAAVFAGAFLLLWRMVTRIARAHLETPSGGFASLTARPFAPLFLLALGPLGSRLAIPQFGRILAVVAVAGALILAAPLARLAARAPKRAQWRSLLVDRGQRYLAHLGFLGVTVGYLLVVRARVFAPSTVGKGRLFTDVTAFSPRPADLLAAVNPHSERFVYIGIVTVLLVIVGALAMRRIADPGQRSRLGFFAATGVGGYVLAVGPHLGRFPAYHLLFQYLPLFNSPRVSGRILHIAVVGLAALAAFGLAGVRGWAGRRAGAVTLVALALLTADYLPRRAPGLTTLPASHPVYDRLAQERRPDETILELPLWPGDTSWSSVYLWYVTRYRNRLLNGYSPAVPRNYAGRIFQPLYPLDFGEMRRPQYDLLRRLGIRFIVFHEEAYPPQVSQFPVRVATESLRRSPYLETVISEPPLWLFRLREEPPAAEPAFATTSPIGSLWEGELSLVPPGERRADPLASDGAVAAYPAGRPGIINRPIPRRVYPTGSFRVLARFLAADGQPLPGLGLTVKHADSGRVIATAGTAAGVLGRSPADLVATFTLEEPTPIFVELTTDGSSAVRWDFLLLTFAAEPEPQLAWEIEDLWHMGRTIADPEASGGQAVQLDPERDPRDFAFSGPNRLLPAGAWVATLRFKAQPAAAPVAGERFEISASGPAAPALASAPLPPLPSGPGYQEIALPFRIERSAPVRLRVFFPGGRSLVLDRVVITPG